METSGVADTLLSGACVLFTLGMFSTGLSDLRHMRMTRRVDNVQFLPFLTTDVNNLSWLSYGTLKRDGTLIVVNAVGAVLQTLYILVYLHYCPRKRAVLLQTAALLGVLLLGFGYFWLLVPSIEVRLQQLGLFCSIFTISMYLSPLTDLAKVIQTKSTQRLSFSLTIATLLTSASWTLYGFRLRDPYIMPLGFQVPNLPGILTSFIRLWLFWKYPQDQDRNYQLLQT
ncbi:sugar transporter SWEET1 isoform X1 [Desmodus rotundus]|uniref:sugar transporter SWEET1 isoform X1 n=2 Tax=Desmodus rotundus TaxID=9430 RepID=UPI000D186550|nr:sugar transporter SWEET1 isoform X1 [Desmodus rotundus]